MPGDITPGPNGNVWFVDEQTNRIGHVTPFGIAKFDAHPDVQTPRSIVAGPDGALWFTSASNARIGRITGNGNITTVTAPGTIFLPNRITLGEDGDLYITDDVTGIVRAECHLGPPFTDVPASHPFAADICWMDALGISTGFPDGTYRPADTVIRQAMSAFMHRREGSPPVMLPVTPSFSDVPASHPFYEEVEWMAQEGITTGFPDGTYRPGDAVTRQAMSAFLYRLEGKPTFEAPFFPSFSDVPLSHPFFDEIEWMADEEITTGFPDGTFKPTALVTRQAMSAFMRRAFEGVSTTT